MVAVVNQEIITLSEVEKWIDPLKDEIVTEDRLERRERVQEICRKVLEKLIEEKLIDQEVKKSGVKVPVKKWKRPWMRSSGEVLPPKRI